MEISGTEQQAAFGMALASFILTNELIGDLVRRGVMQMAEAAALFGSARRSLQRVAHSFPADPTSMQIAEGALTIGEQTVRAFSADKPPEGAH
jgi:hypothetical protein